MSNPESQAERDAFEAAIREINPDEKLFERWSGGQYKHHGMVGRWEGWKIARAALPPVAAVKPWPDRMTEYYAPGNVHVRPVGYFKDQELADWRKGGTVAAVPDGFMPLETVQFWTDAYSTYPHKLGGGMIVRLLKEYLQIRTSAAAAPKPRESA
jgi:hypothetical protein